MAIAQHKPALKRRVTINDLADELGLAKGTISRALNGYPDISASTRVRVTKAAERMGYQPLAQAQAIRTGLARSLGLVLNAGPGNTHKPFLTDFLDGISRAVSKENWSLTVATAMDEADEVATMARLVNERKVDGFILPRTKVVDPRIDLLRERHVPFVLYGRTGDPTDCAWFDIAGEAAIRDAVMRLHGLGHRRIGFINGASVYNYAPLRLQGYKEGLAKSDLPFDPALTRSEAITVGQGERKGGELLQLQNPPTAIVCALDLAALGVYRAAQMRGLDVGHDLSVVSYDGIPEAATASPPLTTFAVDTRAAGSRLASLLFARIRGAAPEGLRETVSAHLIARGSDGPAPTKPTGGFETPSNKNQPKGENT